MNFKQGLSAGDYIIHAGFRRRNGCMRHRYVLEEVMYWHKKTKCPYNLKMDWNIDIQCGSKCFEHVT